MRVQQARRSEAADQSDPRSPSSSHSTEAGRRSALAATKMRRADAAVSDRCCPGQEHARKDA
eukprot:5532065-Alexandrium_andersonii.AAC.1